MDLSARIQAFAELGNRIAAMPDDLKEIVYKTEMYNPWFTEQFCTLMLGSFRDHYLDKNKLAAWTAAYPDLPEKDKTIGLVLAGNVPFVGMHDLLCVLMSGNKAEVKLSSKDTFFFPWMQQQLVKINNAFNDRIVFTEKLTHFDAVIATGSNNSARYFDYYFGKYPHIIRKNRTSVAVLTGEESEAALKELGKDIFYYYGLGCRNVSKIFLPAGFEPEKLFRIWEDFRYVADNTKYKNNYDYNRTLLLLNQTPHLANDFFMLVETDQLFSPLAEIYFEYYADVDALFTKINAAGESLQCVVAAAEGNTPFGQSQFPQITDYADHVDTMEFLIHL